MKVIIDEQTLDVLVTYTTSALKVCSTWTHSDILRALSAIVYYKGPQCQQVDIVAYLFTFTPVCENYCMSVHVYVWFLASQRLFERRWNPSAVWVPVPAKWWVTPCCSYLYGEYLPKVGFFSPLYGSITAKTAPPPFFFSFLKIS